MTTYTPEQLTEIIRKHKAWLRGETDGTRANLTDANLTRANLARANLARANLTRANLTDANLTDANLTCANLTCANLTRANLTDANLTRANLARANLARAKGDPLGNVPVVENVHAKILAAIEAGGTLDMGSWHVCETTHCRAGWVVHLAGDAGKALEAKYGTPCAAAFIECKSEPRLGWKVPNYYGSNDAALAEIRALAVPA